jgi:hypothetical protein
MAHRFNIDEVIDLVCARDGDYDDGIDAFVSATTNYQGHTAVVELTSTEEDKRERVTDRFRVTVERIEAS